MSGTPKTVDCPGKLKRYAQDPVKESYDKKTKKKNKKKKKTSEKTFWAYRV